MGSPVNIPRVTYQYSTVSRKMLYLYIIKIIQLCMRNRSALELRFQLTIWNASMALMLRSWEELLYTLSNLSFYHSICWPFDDTSVIAHWSFFFVLSKIVEFGAEQMAAGRWFIAMNFFAHSCMYTYYTLMTLKYRLPRVYPNFLVINIHIYLFFHIFCVVFFATIDIFKLISVLVTSIQILQMFGGVCISSAVLSIKAFSNFLLEYARYCNLIFVQSISIDNDIIGEPDIECLDEEIRIWVKTRKIFAAMKMQ
uniref:Elongation of very long chain fatty acids protein n=1 Tax=Heterorhabditis bacteriophora TaxID=37862 RepID=A0A1I7W8R3_HETBA